MTDFSMDTACPMVSQAMTMELLDPTGLALPLQSELQYDASDPYTAVLIFDTTRGPVRWDFARDLLIAGLHEATGDGDVHVWPHRDAADRALVVIELTSGEGYALVHARQDDVSRFLDRTTAVVAPGTESDHLDMDAVIEALLETA